MSKKLGSMQEAFTKVVHMLSDTAAVASAARRDGRTGHYWHSLLYFSEALALAIRMCSGGDQHSRGRNVLRMLVDQLSPLNEKLLTACVAEDVEGAWAVVEQVVAVWEAGGEAAKRTPPQGVA